MHERSNPDIDMFDEIVRAHEDAILGALFLEPKAALILEHVGLESRHFHRPTERAVFSLIKELLSRSNSIDATAILIEMRAAGLADEHHQAAWVGSLAHRANLNQAITYHCSELIRLSELLACQNSLVVAMDPNSDPASIVGELNRWVRRKSAGMSAVTYSQLEFDYPSLREPVIEGLLRVGEVANIIAPPKTGKSFLAGGLAWCVATGRPWLGRNVLQGKVLLLDNELHPATIANRLERIAHDMQIEHSQRVGVDVVSLRGRLTTIDRLAHSVDIVPNQYLVVIIDALYRMLPRGVSENDNAAMTNVYNELDNLAEKWQAAIVIVHHSSKGSQGDKSVTDIGAGAGSIARAADTHIAIREHESEGHHVLEARTRSFATPEPISIKYKYPIWNATTLAPAVRRPTRHNAEAQQQLDNLAKTELIKAIPINGEIQQSDLVESVGWGKERLKRIASQLIKEGAIARTERIVGSRERVFYSRAELKTESRSE